LSRFSNTKSQRARAGDDPRFEFQGVVQDCRMSDTIKKHFGIFDRHEKRQSDQREKQPSLLMYALAQRELRTTTKV
jgi:hypothetical protein